MTGAAIFANKLLAPNHPNPEKLTSYECGEEPTGSAWIPFNSRFYVIALIFLLFDVEMVFIFPWATVFSDKHIQDLDPRWSTLTLVEMFVFVSILILGLVYVWRKGDLNWIKPEPVIPAVEVNIPKSAYDQLNIQQENFKVRAFSAEPATAQAFTSQQPADTATVITPIKKPMFKPTFKKPTNDTGNE